MAKKATAAGRPAGSPNRDYVSLAVIPPACPRCEGTQFSQRQQTVGRSMEGHYQGRPYNQIVWSKARCDSCGQWVTFREYHLIGDGE